MVKAIFKKEITSCFDCPDKVLGYEGRACCKHSSDRRYGMEHRSDGIRKDCPYICKGE